MWQPRARSLVIQACRRSQGTVPSPCGLVRYLLWCHTPRSLQQPAHLVGEFLGPHLGTRQDTNWSLGPHTRSLAYNLCRCKSDMAPVWEGYRHPELQHHWVIIPRLDCLECLEHPHNGVAQLRQGELLPDADTRAPREGQPLPPGSYQC
jgi:hypothetical protein